MLIDIHCHLDHPRYDDIDAVIQRAKDSGVKVILSNGINKETNRKTLKLAESYDIVKPALGIYPIQQLKKEITEGGYPLKDEPIDIDEELEFIQKNKDTILAIGEIGLDGLDPGSMEEQKITFIRQLKIANEISKPVIIHSRKAEAQVLDILEQEQQESVVLHCFSGNKKLIKRGISLGCHFSIPTNVVFSEHFQHMAKDIDLSMIFTETDGPYLSPFKGQRNEPAFIIEAVRKIAEIKGITVDDTQKNIFLNYQRLFL